MDQQGIKVLTLEAFEKQLQERKNLPSFVYQYSFLQELCLLLHRIGEVFFVKHKDNIESSFVVLDPQWMSQKLVGFLFCPEELIDVAELSKEQKKQLKDAHKMLKRREEGSKSHLTLQDIKNFSLGLEGHFDGDVSAIAAILEEMKLCVRLGGNEEEGLMWFPCFTNGALKEGRSCVRHGEDFEVDGNRVLGRRYELNEYRTFLPGFFPRLFGELMTMYREEECVKKSPQNHKKQRRRFQNLYDA